MEPEDKKPGADWHSYTIYILTTDHLSTFNGLKQAVKHGEGAYVFYDGDVFAGPSLEAFEIALGEEAAAQCAKMSQGAVSSFQKPLGDTGIGKPECDNPPQEAQGV